MTKLAGFPCAASLTAAVSTFALSECLQLARAPVRVSCSRVSGRRRSAAACDAVAPSAGGGPNQQPSKRWGRKLQWYGSPLQLITPLPCNRLGALVCRGPCTLTPYCCLPVHLSCNPDVREVLWICSWHHSGRYKKLGKCARSTPFVLHAAASAAAEVDPAPHLAAGLLLGGDAQQLDASTRAFAKGSMKALVNLVSKVFPL